MSEMLKSLTTEHLTNMGLEVIAMRKSELISEERMVELLLEIDAERATRD